MVKNRYHPTWKMVWHSIWTFESPSPRDALCQVRLKLAQCLWERRYLRVGYLFSLFLLLFPPWSRASNFIWTYFKYIRMLCAKFGWNWLSGSGEEDENVKSLQTDGRTDRLTDRQTDNGRKVIRKAHLSFQLRWAKNDHLIIFWLKFNH